MCSLYFVTLIIINTQYDCNTLLHFVSDIQRTPHPNIGNHQDLRVSTHFIQSNLKFMKDLKIEDNLSCFVVTLTPKLLPKIEAELIKGFDKTIAIESVL